MWLLITALTCNPGGWRWGRAGPLEDGPHQQLNSLLTHLQPPRTQAYVKPSEIMKPLPAQVWLAQYQPTHRQPWMPHSTAMIVKNAYRRGYSAYRRDCVEETPGAIRAAHATAGLLR